MTAIKVSQDMGITDVVLLFFYLSSTSASASWEVISFLSREEYSRGA